MMSGLMSDPKEELQQPEDDGSLQYWMWCEEEEEVSPEEYEWDGQPDEAQAVSYTHLTLPTILRV